MNKTLLVAFITLVLIVLIAAATISSCHNDKLAKEEARAEFWANCSTRVVAVVPLEGLKMKSKKGFLFVNPSGLEPSEQGFGPLLKEGSKSRARFEANCEDGIIIYPDAVAFEKGDVNSSYVVILEEYLVEDVDTVRTVSYYYPKDSETKAWPNVPGQVRFPPLGYVHFRVVLNPDDWDEITQLSDKKLERWGLNGVKEEM